MNYLVIWFVMSWLIVPCQHQGPYTDEFGRVHQNYAVTLEICTKDDSKRMEKYFDTLKDAEAFVSRGKEESRTSYQHRLSGWKIENRGKP